MKISNKTNITDFCARFWKKSEISFGIIFGIIISIFIIFVWAMNIIKYGGLN